MRNELNFFINKKIVADIYREDGKEDIDLDIDRDLARTLLEHVKTRIDMLNRPASRRGSARRPWVKAALPSSK
jgi:hypothetical protein